MRPVHVPEHYRAGVFDYLEGEGIDYVVLAEDGDSCAVEEILSRPEYDRLTLVSVEAAFGWTPVLDGP